MEKRVKYDAKELAEMAIRNIDSAKSCSGGACADPVDCVAKVFAAPLETLANVERENIALRREIEIKRMALESAVANIHDLPPAVKDEFRKALPGHPHLN